MDVHVDRRALLLLTGGSLVAGCTRGGSSTGSASPSVTASPSPSPSPTPTQTPSPTAGDTSTPSPSASPTPELPKVTRWQPSPNDNAPQAKITAVRAIERRLTGRRSAVQVLDAQFGGLLTSTASVLVPCRTWRRTSAGVATGGATYDVRLTRGTTGWRVTDVFASRPGPAHRLTRDERAVLDRDRIVLPPAAQADVRSGRVHVSVLAAMLRLSQRYRIGASVIRSGHPLHVFGTDRLSDHPQGRAFDTFMIDGELVVARGTQRSLVTGYMEAAARAGSYNVGGPYLLGAAPQWFSDQTHHDHVHAGFSA